jgi:protein gp37
MPTKIEWCDEVINPLGWGCYGPGGTPEKPKPCSYCYARRIAARNLRPCPLCREFTPHWHPEQLDKPHYWKKPKKIFVQSMGDLMHPFTPAFHIELVKSMIRVNPRHTFILLTKNADRYQKFNPWPSNCWVGTTVTNQADADERIPWLLKADAPVRFVSHEPLLSAIDLSPFKPFSGECYCQDSPNGCKPHLTPNCPEKAINWAVIGAMTGPGAVRPKLEWIESFIEQYRAAGVPLFLKNNLRLKFHENPQNWPTP